MEMLRVLMIKIIILNLKCTCHRAKIGAEIDTITKRFMKHYKSTPKSSKPAVTFLVAGGVFAAIKDYPHSVLFINYGDVCAGTILSYKLVLTSAHCLDHNKRRSEMTVFAGARYYFDRSADIHKVWKFVIHDRYNHPIRFSNDAALLIILEQFVFKSTVRKGLLINHKDWMKPGTVVTVTGWGETKVNLLKEKNHSSNTGFQKANLTLLSLNECRESAGTVVTPDMFCLWGNRTPATCRGDPGGGALWRGIVVGIVSHGGLCTEFPGLYTNVYYLREWIEKACSKLNHRFCNFYL